MLEFVPCLDPSEEVKQNRMRFVLGVIDPYKLFPFRDWIEGLVDASLSVDQATPQIGDPEPKLVLESEQERFPHLLLIPPVVSVDKHADREGLVFYLSYLLLVLEQLKWLPDTLWELCQNDKIENLPLFPCHWNEIVDCNLPVFPVYSPLVQLEISLIHFLRPQVHPFLKSKCGSEVLPLSHHPDLVVNEPLVPQGHLKPVKVLVLHIVTVALLDHLTLVIVVQFVGNPLDLLCYVTFRGFVVPCLEKLFLLAFLGLPRVVVNSFESDRHLEPAAFERLESKVEPRLVRRKWKGELTLVDILLLTRLTVWLLGWARQIHA